MQHATSSTIIAHTGNFTGCLSHSTCTGWVMDYSASDHMIGNVSLFSKLSTPKYPHYVTVVDESKVEATGVGQVSLIPPPLSLYFIYS